jgi:hypothetical protein
MKDLHLLLTSPCSQEWDEMQQAGAGRYCDQCSKNIIDLTHKTDAELIQFFKRKQDNVCGRLLSSQLNRTLVLPPSKMSWQWMLPFALGAVAISPVQAVGLRPVVVQDNHIKDSPRTSSESVSELHRRGDKIRGRVIDIENGKPLSGVKIRKKGSANVLAITDSTGRFELAITISDVGIPYSFGASGYSTVETSLKSDMLIKLSIQKIMLGGISSVAGIRAHYLWYMQERKAVKLMN